MTMITILITYQVIVIDEEGQETEDTVDLLDTTWPHRQR